MLKTGLNVILSTMMCDSSPRHGCQNPDLDPTILRFYDPTYPKRSKSFKDLYDRSRSVGSYDSDDPKRHWFLVIFFNLTKGSVGPKLKVKSQ